MNIQKMQSLPSHSNPVHSGPVKCKTIDIMLDLETIGLCDNAIITQLAAVAFLIEDGTILDTFNEHIGIKPSVKKGLKMDVDTIEWWCKQSDKVYEDVFVRSVTSEVKIEDVLIKFNTWIDSLKFKYAIDRKTNINIWGNGALADNKWIRQAYKICGMEPPWSYQDDRDVRTLVELGTRMRNYEHKKTVFEGTLHNALDDCKHQIKYCSEIYNKLKKSEA